jgi:PAS domain S-box-containing protein
VIVLSRSHYWGSLPTSGESVVTEHPKALVPYLSANRHMSGVQRRAMKWTRYFCALAATVLSYPFAAAQTKEVRRVLILNEVGPSYPAIALSNQGIQSALNDSQYRLEFYSEYFETLLFPDPAIQQEFRDFYIHKYQNRKPDVIITVGPSPLKFMKQYHKEAFPGVPIVFCLPEGSVPGTPALDSDFTGTENDIAADRTLEIALRLQPGTEHVMVVGGVSDVDKQEQAAVKQQLKGFTNYLDVTYMTDLAMPDLLEHLRHLPSHTVVLLASISQDAARTRFKSRETGPMIATAANAPVFVLFDVDLNDGEVGGYVSSIREEGRMAGGIALRLLRGDKLRDIPPAQVVNTYMFDWRAIKRWRLMEKEIPPGSIVLNRQLTLWESYKRYIVSGIALILLEALLIGGLVWQRARRRKVEADLAIAYDRLRLAVEAGKSVGWDWDVQSGRNQWFGDLQAMFGIPADSYSGDAEDFYRTVHPEDRELVRKAVADARQSRKPYIAEFRIIRDDRAVRWVTATGKFYYAPNGDPDRMLGMAVDITERKRAEEALQQRETELKEAQRLAGLGSWQWEPRTDTVIWSKELYRLMGIDPTLPAPSYKEHAHLFAAESWERLQRAVQEALQVGTPYELDLEVVRPESIAKWEIARGEPVRDKGGPIIGLRGTVQDITERKQAEEAVRESEERFRLVANNAPVMIWMSGLDTKPTYFNQLWLDFTGLSEDDLLNGLAGIVHPEDYLRCHDVYCRGFDQRQPFRKECRLRRHDGQYRWILAVGVPRFLKDGSFAGYIGTCIDVTDRKLADDALTNMSRKLVQAQEQERARIARELHDDISQRLAMLGIDLQRLREHYPELPIEISGRVEELQEQTTGISNDVQALSHQLHSSKLEYLGAIGGMKSWCNEFAERQGLQIEFKGPESKMPLPPEVGLSLFRVLQEALHNAAKHSGVRRIEVQLREDSGKIHLIVSDLGKGFNVETAMQSRGLGLASMQERLRLVGGELSIESQPQHGSTIHARVPLGSGADSIRAAG